MSIVSDNLRTILSELNMSQVDFAKSVGTTFGYLNMVVNNRRPSISQPLALLIEKEYGYSASWILHNEGDKRINAFKSNGKFREMAALIDQLSSDEIDCLFEFILSLEEAEKAETAKRKLKKQKTSAAGPRQ
jgi:transcriptional regulator with XRE-family HTH domain